MMVPPIRWMVGMLPRADQTSLAPVALAILRPSSKLAFHSATASWSKLWVIFASGMLHEGGEIGPEQIEAGIGEAAEIARLERGARDNEGAAEGAFLAGLAVAVVGHELRAGGAHVVLDVLIEHRPRARAEMRHHVFPEQPARIGEPFGMLVGRGVEHQARFCADHAARTTTLASCTCRSF